MDGGYPLECFVEPVDERWICKLCSKVLRRAKTTPCGRFYCKTCLERWTGENGVCPRRCCEVVSQNTLAWAGHVDTVVSGLKTHCKNANSGCRVQVPLGDRNAHELCCPLNDTTTASASGGGGLVGGEGGQADETDDGRRRSNSYTQLDSRLDDFEDEKESSLGFFQRATRIVLSFRSGRNPRKKKPSNAKPTTSNSSKEEKEVYTESMATQRTYRMKRNKPKEPLGLVLVSGDKTSDGRHKSYYVKKVNKDTLGWRAGIQAGDRIIKVDNFDLCNLTPQESVARIKEKSVVTLTVLRESGTKKLKSPESHSHIYDEIFADQQLSQHALSQPTPRHQPTLAGLLPHALSQYDENRPPTPPPMDFEKFSPSTQHKLRLSATNSPKEDHLGGSRHRDRAMCLPSGAQAPRRASPVCGPGERTSKDSGLSSGSSDSNPTQRPGNTARQLPPTPLTEDLDRGEDVRKSYRTEREMVSRYIKSHRRGGGRPVVQQDGRVPSSQPRNSHIMGEYELEEIHLQKNGTSQLGITLGYDAANGGCLYVCEVVPGSLAAADGRLRIGDIIQKVNGFKVFDPEEAVLLFLEQDQDITLNVARKIKVPSKLRPLPEPDLDYLESTLLREGVSLRKVDSCGSLDTHSHHHYATLEPPPGFEPLPTLQPPSETGVSLTQAAVVLRERAREMKTIAASYDSVTVPTSPSQQLAGEDDPYHSRHSSPPGQPGNLLSSSRQITASSPNLLKMASGGLRTPPSLSHHSLSGTHLLPPGGHPLGPSTSRLRVSHDRSLNTSPEGKQFRPREIIHQYKYSTPNIAESSTTSGTHEPRIMVPPSPTKTPPSFRNAASDIHRLPSRFETGGTFLDPSSAGPAQGRRESLV